MLLAAQAVGVGGLRKESWIIKADAQRGQPGLEPEWKAEAVMRGPSWHRGLSPDPWRVPHSKAPPLPCILGASTQSPAPFSPSRCGRMCHGAGPVRPRLPQHAGVL